MAAYAGRDWDTHPGCMCNECEGFGPKKTVVPFKNNLSRISMDDESLTQEFKAFMKKLYSLIDKEAA